VGVVALSLPLSPADPTLPKTNTCVREKTRNIATAVAALRGLEFIEILLNED
jgi:hypothetical protein